MTDTETQFGSMRDNRSQAPAGGWRRFSLLNLLALMTAVAAWLPWFSLRGEPERLTNEIDMMNEAVGQLLVTDPAKMVAIDLPKFDSRFENWKVYVPDDQSDLRFAVEDIHDLGIPAAFESVQLSQGEHEISLKSESNTRDGYEWALFVDGEEVVHEKRPASWMDSVGSSSTGDTSKVAKSFDASEPLTLVRRRYTYELALGKNSSIGLSPDPYQAAKGTYVWIDRQTHQPESISPWLDHSRIGISSDGLGLRSGIRLGQLTSFQNALRFFHPDTMSRWQPVAKLAMTFEGDGTWPSVSTRNNNLGDWKMSDQPDRIVPSTMTKGDSQQRVVYLHYQPKTDGLKPVVEIRFDLTRPDEVGFRLLPSEGERKIRRWTLQAISGKTYQWRELTTSEKVFSVKDIEGVNPPTDVFSLPLSRFNLSRFKKSQNAVVPSVEVRLEPNAALPGGSAARNVPYANRFEGLSNQHSWVIPHASNGRVKVQVSDHFDDAAKTLIPGGKVLSEVHVTIDDPNDEVIRYRIDVDPLVQERKP